MTRLSILTAALLATLMHTARAQKRDHTLMMAETAFRDLKFPEAIRLYERQLLFWQDRKKPVDSMVFRRIAECYWNMRDYQQSVRWFNRMPRQMVLSDTSLRKKRAELYAMQGRYDSAKALLSGLPAYADRARGFGDISGMLRDSLDWKVGYPRFNTPNFNEFSPLLFRGKLIWSTNEPALPGRRPLSAWDERAFVRQMVMDQILESSISTPAVRTLDDSAARPNTPRKLAYTYANSENSIRSRPFVRNTDRESALRTNEVLRELQGLEGFDFNIGHATASEKSGRIYFSANTQDKATRDSIRTLQILEADLLGIQLKNPRILRFSINDSVAMHPAIHPNGRLLVYSAHRRGSRGYDLYVTYLDSLDRWAEPMEISELNTDGNEVFPTFNELGVLYFSSDGHPGMGGLDIYRTNAPLLDKYEGFEPLSAPINSAFDDFGWTEIAGFFMRGYITSNRYGSDDIFSFQFEPRKVDISGPVINDSTGLREKGIPVTLYELTSEGEWVPVAETVSDANGNYRFEGRPNREYAIRLGELDGRTLAKNDQEYRVKTTGEDGQESTPPFFIRRVGEGWQEGSLGRVTERKVDKPREFIVYFDFDKSDIKPEGEGTLTDLMSYLQTRPTARLMLVGHTDLEGTQHYNMLLSERRSRAVRDRLVQAGLGESRMQMVSYGMNWPRVRSKEKSAGWQNRRVEVVVFQ